MTLTPVGPTSEEVGAFGPAPGPHLATWAWRLTGGTHPTSSMDEEKVRWDEEAGSTCPPN